MFVMSPPSHNTPVHCRHPVNAVRCWDVMCGAESCSSGSGQPGDVLWHTSTHVHCRHPVNAVRVGTVLIPSFCVAITGGGGVHKRQQSSV